SSWVLLRIRYRQRPRVVALLYGARRSLETIREQSTRGGREEEDWRGGEVRRRWLALGRPLVRPGSEPDLCRHRQWRSVAADTPWTGRLRQPVRLLHSCRESG